MESIETKPQEESSAYSVKLDVFEGPLDLLLFSRWHRRCRPLPQRHPGRVKEMFIKYPT